MFLKFGMKNFSDLSDADVIKAVEDLKSEKKHLELENMVFERFLQKNDPALIQGLWPIKLIVANIRYRYQLQTVSNIFVCDIK